MRSLRALLLLSLQNVVSPVAAQEPYRVALAHVLVLHREAAQGSPDSRTREAARTLATRVHGETQLVNADFAALCRVHSEDAARRENGGFLGIFRRGELADSFAAFEKRAFALGIGEVSPVVESPLGFHILRRVPLVEWRARHILIRFRGARDAPESIERSKEDARKLAAKVATIARRPNADFGTLARRYSESPDRVSRGALGVFTRGERLTVLCDALEKLEVGAISAPVESPHGFHVLRRESLDARRFAVIRVPRVRPPERAEDASDLAREVQEKAVRGDDFDALARRHSVHPRARLGGDLGLLPVERLPKPLVNPARKLRLGAVSEVLRTQDAFWIVKRLSPAN